MENSIILESEQAFEFDIIRGLSNLIDNKNLYYHIYVTNDSIEVEKRGYETPIMDKVSFDTKGLNDDETEQTKDAIVAVYQYVFSKNNELKNRLTFILDSQNSNYYWYHTFYHDYTGRYQEQKIAEKIVHHNKKSASEETQYVNKKIK